MTITLHCLDCGFRFSLTLATGAITGRASQDRSRAASADAGAGQRPDCPPRAP